jgi:Ca2+-binding EF-hand superfamily protein
VFVSVAEIQHIFWKECVSVFDSDNDGKVDFTEAMSMLKVLGCGLPEDEINELVRAFVHACIRLL